MSMLDMLEKEINSLNLFEGNLPEIVKAIANSIPSQTIPYRMKLALAVSEIVLFTSQFRKNIKHWNDSNIPVNSIMFCVAKSGASKDSSVKAARKCFESGYKILNQVRHDNAVYKAIEQAREAGYDIPERFSSYKDFYVAPNPLFVAISTPEGFIQHLNDLSDDIVGAGFTFDGEIGHSLATSANLVENLKLLAELYDEGTKEVKILKSRENQSREIKNLPVGALYIGSQDNLLYDDVIKKRFKTEFTSKLARRSMFIFVNEDVILPTYNTIAEMVHTEAIIEDKAVEARVEVGAYIKDLTEALLALSDEQIRVSNEARSLFTLYKRYNEEVASSLDNQFPIARLTRAHLQWKALKLAGAFALIEGETTISEDNYKGAIEFLELINNDISNFEKELVKEPYEIFSDYCRYYSTDGMFSVSLHNLRKLGFIPQRGQSATLLKELVKLVSSYDAYGIYTLKDDVITFQELEKTEHMFLSYLPCTGTKEARKKRCDEGFTCESVVFKDIEAMLEGDFAYSPFKFRNGHRGTENIESKCKWIVLDVDDQAMTDKDAHILLSDLNHYVVRTSNNTNPNKFRVLLELDVEIDIPSNEWTKFTGLIAYDLGLIRDPLGKAQIYFSYSGRDIYSQLDGGPLQVKPYLVKLSETQRSGELKKPSNRECSSLLDNPLDTFAIAFNAKQGEGSRRMYWAAKRARELGADREYCLNLVKQINDYWVQGLEPHRLENTFLIPIRDRWIFD